MPPPQLSQANISAIHSAVDQTFDKLKLRFLGPQSIGKRIYVNVGYVRHDSLPGLFEAAGREEGVAANMRALHQILKVAGGFVDATRERVKARVVREVQGFLTDAFNQNVNTDLETVLGGKLTEVWSETAHAVRRIIDTEATHTRNLGVLDGIVRINAQQGIEDPVVYFVVVRDSSLCSECKRLHLLPDGITPRLWHLSDVGGGYHSKGDETPKQGGLHPHCRCSMVTLMPGYGFDPKGMVTYIKKDHDEFARQRSL